MDGGGWRGKIAHGKDIFRKIKDLRVGWLQKREQAENEGEKRKRSDSVQLIDLGEAAEEEAAGMHPLPKVLIDARCCSPLSITCTSDRRIPHHPNEPHVDPDKPTSCHFSSFLFKNVLMNIRMCLHVHIQLTLLSIKTRSCSCLPLIL